MSILLMRLTGPMQSWGIQSRFSVRDTGLEPSRSGVIGLLCCALGQPRSASLDRFQPDRLQMGVRIDHEGRMERDWHTALDVAKAGGGPPKDCEPSQRYYLADASFLVALRGDEGFLKELHAALIKPVWPLFLGRKSFVPGQPIWLHEGVMPDEEIEAVLRKHPWLPCVKPPGRLRMVLETTASTTSDAVIEPRHDVPLSFADRRFTVRHVCTLWIDDPINHLPLVSESLHVPDETDSEPAVLGSGA